MKPLWLLGVTGLYQEFYQPDTKSLLTPNTKINENFLDSGGIFWSSLLQTERVVKVVNSLEKNIHNPKHQRPQFLGIIANKDKFISDVVDYRISICDQGISPAQFFSKLETLSILCELYSLFEFYPFQLSLQNGFLLNEVSAKELIFNSLTISHNPYLAFINESIIPLIMDYYPDVIFCMGRISYFFIALARLIKENLPNVHVCFTRHSSEYYSLNKIEKYLRQNDSLFTVIDSIILEYFNESEQILLERLSFSKAIYSLPNIFTKKDKINNKKNRNKVPQRTSLSHILGRKKQVSGLKLSPEFFFDIHFEPYVKCYWNKCVFCGINKKYTHEDCIEGKDVFERKIQDLCNRLPNNSFLWFIDEAIQPSKLRKIAEYFISNNLRFTWQARCRIDKNLLSDDLPAILARSGLKELRLGLESASLRILELMKKFEDGFQLNQVEKIVKIYTEHGISIHFPIIIGFPGEEVADRQKTYDFLTTIKNQYPSVTFNINIFNLDVSSTLFKRWDDYAISKIVFPCSPADFIGNIVDWDGPGKPEGHILERERNSFMRSKLYPWMPSKSFITPILFYRLSETIRNTLGWKNLNPNTNNLDFSVDLIIQRSNNLVVKQKPNGEYLAYNWDTHHYIEGQEIMNKILITWDLPKSIGQGIVEIEQENSQLFDKKDITILVKKLLNHGHLVIIRMMTKTQIKYLK